MDNPFNDQDPDAAKRKEDHITLAFSSRQNMLDLDSRFYYEPMLKGHPDSTTSLSKSFLGKTFSLPIWVSSMTGGTAKAGLINQNLARACREFGMGMGLGSCRQLLKDDTYLTDFQVRKHIGDQPLYANLGIAQIIQLLENKQFFLVSELIKKLEADGLIVHINPLQEYLQPEGDRYFTSPLEVIKTMMDFMDPATLIVKEVGQGMGIQSLTALFSLPIAAVDLAASGGTNFALLELLRTDKGEEHPLRPLADIGHTAEEMIEMTNALWQRNPGLFLCKQIIISGGITNFLDGYYLMGKSLLPSVYGQASGFLKHAMGSYELLQQHVSTQRDGLMAANNFLHVKL